MRWAPVLLLVVGLLLGSCSDGEPDSAGERSDGGAATGESSSGTPVVVDTDVAGEGMMALLYLLNRPELDVRAITVSGTGLVHCDAGVEQVLGLLALVGAEDVPVACGPQEPLEGYNAFPTSWRIAADEAYGLRLPASGTASDLDAPSLLAATILESASPVVVYTDGPLTNLALALRGDPAIAGNVAAVYMMGGAIDVPGNVVRNEDAEWNVWVDPTAADEVLRSGLPITLVPLDATNRVPLTVFHLDALRTHDEAVAAATVVQLLEGNEQLASGGLYFWDQLTAAVLADESYVTLEPMRLKIVLDDDRSIAGRVMADPDGAQVRVATDVDAPRFERDFLSALAGTDVGEIVIEADAGIHFDGTAWSHDLPAELAPGTYTLRMSNGGAATIIVVFGWLLDDATVADMEAWESMDQPPFYEIASFLQVAAGSETLATVDLAGPQTYLVVGLDMADDAPAVLGTVDVAP